MRTKNEGDVTLRPHGKLKIINEEILALYDTGSTITLLSGKVYDRLIPQPELSATTASVRAAQGTHMTVRGVICVKIQALTESFEMTRKMVIIDGLSSDCIIGMDTIQSEGI